MKRWKQTLAALAVLALLMTPLCPVYAEDDALLTEDVVEAWIDEADEDVAVEDVDLIDDEEPVAVEIDDWALIPEEDVEASPAEEEEDVVIEANGEPDDALPEIEADAAPDAEEGEGEDADVEDEHILDVNEIAIGIGETFRLQIGGANVLSSMGYKFKSSDAAVAKVAAGTGLITAKAVGAATITVTSPDGETDFCAVTVGKAPTKVTLNVAARTLGVGETYTLKPAVPAGAASQFAFASSKSSVASVSADGVIKAKKVGTAKIGVKTFNGKTAVCTITVKPAPTSLKLNATTATLGVGETFTVKATRSSGSAGVISYAVGDKKIIAYKSGVLTGKAPGTAMLTATTYNGKSAALTVTVMAAPTSIVLDSTAVTIGVGETLTLKPTVPEGEYSGSFTYSSTKVAVAKVSAAGVVTGVKAGSAKIAVKAYNGVTVKLAVTVVKAPTKVTLNIAKRSMGVGETYQLQATLPSGTASALKYSSNNTAVATVSKAGLIRAKKAGTATITVKTFNGKKATCAITVKPAPTSLSFSVSSVTLGVGETLAATAARSSGSAGVIRYAVSDKSVIAYKSGTLTAVGNGEATLTATSYNGLTATIDVTVVDAPTKLTLSDAAIELAVTATDYYPKKHTLTAAIDEGSSSAITFVSSNTAVATVSAKGVVTAKKAGTATITASTYNGKTKKCKVTVKNPKARALLVGQSDFCDLLGGTATRNLGDVKLMNKMLASVRSPEAGAYSGNITRKTNLNVSQLKSAISSTFGSAGDDDVSLFFIATHGITETSGSRAGALVMTDVGVQDGGDLLSSDIITLKTLANCLSKVKGKVIVVIEACGSGAAVKENGVSANGASGAAGFDADAFANAVVDAFADADPGYVQKAAVQSNSGAFATEKFRVLTASDIGQDSYGAEMLGYNFFTKWLTDGVGTSGTMNADADANGRTTLAELYDYIVSVEPTLPNTYGDIYVQNAQVYPENSLYDLFAR